MTEICLAIVGCRKYSDYKRFCSIVDKWITAHGKPITIISGGASGVDTMAERYANENGIDFIVFKADWQKYGRAAGPVRNKQIVSEATHILALPSADSVGTRDTIAKSKGKHVTVVEI